MEKEGSRFAFDGRIGSDNDLFNGIVRDAREEFFDVEFLGGDAVDGGDGATEDMISAAVGFGLFDGVDVERFFDDEDGSFVAGGVGIKFGKVGVGVDKSKGFRAGLYARMKRGESGGESFGKLWVGAKKKVGVAFGGARTDAWEGAERVNDICEGFWKHSFSVPAGT